MPFQRLFIKLSAFIVMTIITLTYSFAASFQGTAHIRIAEPISLSEIATLNMNLSSFSDGECLIDSQGDLQAGSGSDCNGSAQNAQFEVDGDPDSQINILVSGSAQQNGIDFSPLLHSPTLTTLDNSGQTTVDIGAHLQLNNAQAGNYQFPYALSVNYQ